MAFWSASITEVLNQWNQAGIFSYVLPFLLVFAVVFAILSKTGLFKDNRGVNAVIALAIGLLSLQFDIVPMFFANIFPKFGVVIALFIVAVILISFFYEGETKSMKWFGWVLGIGLAIWALVSFTAFGNIEIGSWIEENFWALVILFVVALSIYLIARKPKG